MNCKEFRKYNQKFDLMAMFWLAERRFEDDAADKVQKCAIEDFQGNRSPLSVLDGLTFDADRYCGTCGCPTHGKMVDMGIGPGEAWGTKFVDTRMEYVSECCEGIVFSDPTLQDEIVGEG